MLTRQQHVNNNPVNLTDHSGKVIDTFWDLIVFGVDLLLLFFDSINPTLDECTREELLSLDRIALGIDAAALLIPVAPGGGGLAGRLAGRGVLVLAQGGVRISTRVIRVSVQAGVQAGVHASAMTKGSGKGSRGSVGNGGRSGGNEDIPRNLRKLSDNEVKKLGLHLEKQKWELPGDTALYLDDATKNVYYRVNEKGAPFQHMVNLKDVRKGQ
jgi:hypothetical protein